MLRIPALDYIEGYGAYGFCTQKSYLGWKSLGWKDTYIICHAASKSTLSWIQVPTSGCASFAQADQIWAIRIRSKSKLIEVCFLQVLLL